ncbi:hypothetical protein GOODEAATRI_006948, partial [Goodea atripinnis]
LFETLQSLFWSVFGLLNLYVTNVKARHEFTEFVGATMFGTYNVISLVVLLNMLIAMMNNSYQLIAVSYSLKLSSLVCSRTQVKDHADIEWKFARTKLWMSYFDEGGTLPPPFNIIPSPKSFWYLLMWLHNKLCRRGQPPGELSHKCENLREFTELKQDISSFRYEVLDLLGNRRPPRRHYSSSSETTKDDGAMASEDDSESGDGTGGGVGVQKSKSVTFSNPVEDDRRPAPTLGQSAKTDSFKRLSYLFSRSKRKAPPTPLPLQSPSSYTISDGLLRPLGSHSHSDFGLSDVTRSDSHLNEESSLTSCLFFFHLSFTSIISHLCPCIYFFPSGGPCDIAAGSLGVKKPQHANESTSQNVTFATMETPLSAQHPVMSRPEAQGSTVQ